MPSFNSLITRLQEHAAHIPERTALEFLVDGEEATPRLSYQQLNQHAKKLATLLQSIESPGDRALLLYPPGLDYVSAFFGCLYAGVVAVPAYPPDVMRMERSLPRFLAIVKSADPKVILTTSPIMAMAQMILTQYPGMPAMQWVATDQLLVEPDGSNWIEPDLKPDQLAFLQYTSGSTAEPKGVMLTHQNLSYNLEVISRAFDLNVDSDRGMFWLPLYHDMGLIGAILGTVYNSITTTLMSPLDFLQRPMRWLRAISHLRATVSGGPNFAYDLCARKATPEQIVSLDLSCWQIAVNGAEPVRPETLHRFAQVFAPCGFDAKAMYPCYGLAEATLLVSSRKRMSGVRTLRVKTDALTQDQVEETGDDDLDSRLLVGCGQTWLEQKIVIVEPDTFRECKPDRRGNTRVGEIWVSGESIAQGYWGRPEESQRTFFAHLDGQPAQRYLRTGDLGFLSRGDLYITGRSKDLIIIDGLNHYPQDIELTVENCHPALRPGCSAAFSADRRGQERLVVVVEMAKQRQLTLLQQEQGVDINPDSVLAAIRNAITSQHDLHVDDIILLKPGSLMKTSSGKIQRHACREGYLTNTLEVWKSD